MTNIFSFLNPKDNIPVGLTSLGLKNNKKSCNNNDNLWTIPQVQLNRSSYENNKIINPFISTDQIQYYRQ